MKITTIILCSFLLFFSCNGKSIELKSSCNMKNDITDIILGGLKVKEIIQKYNYKKSDFIPYTPFSYDRIKSSGINVQFLGYYIRWDQQEAYYFSSKYNGFSPNTERTEGSYSKYSSIDDKIDVFHYYRLNRKLLHVKVFNYCIRLNNLIIKR